MILLIPSTTAVDIELMPLTKVSANELAIPTIPSLIPTKVYPILSLTNTNPSLTAVAPCTNTFPTVLNALTVCDDTLLPVSDATLPTVNPNYCKPLTPADMAESALATNYFPTCSVLLMAMILPSPIGFMILLAAPFPIVCAALTVPSPIVFAKLTVPYFTTPAISSVFCLVAPIAINVPCPTVPAALSVPSLTVFPTVMDPSFILLPTLIVPSLTASALILTVFPKL